MIKIFSAGDTSFSSNGDIVISNALKANVRKVDNGDYYLDFECGVFIYNMNMLQDVISDFEETFRASQLIDVGDLQKISVFRRIIRAILKLFAPLM